MTDTPHPELTKPYHYFDVTLVQQRTFRIRIDGDDHPANKGRAIEIAKDQFNERTWQYANVCIPTGDSRFSAAVAVDLGVGTVFGP